MVGVCQAFEDVTDKKQRKHCSSMLLHVSDCSSFIAGYLLASGTFGFPPRGDALRIRCADKSPRLQVNFRLAYSDSDQCWQTETADSTSQSGVENQDGRTESQTDFTETGRGELGPVCPTLSGTSQAWSHYLSLNGVCLPAARLSPHPVTPPPRGSIPVWVYAGRHLSTCVTHSRNKTKACTKRELAISANTFQPAR